MGIYYYKRGQNLLRLFSALSLPTRSAVCPTAPQRRGVQSPKATLLEGIEERACVGWRQVGCEEGSLFHNKIDLVVFDVGGKDSGEKRKLII